MKEERERSTKEREEGRVELEIEEHRVRERRKWS